MNPTLDYLWARMRSSIATRPHAIRKHVLVDLQSPPPEAGQNFNGQKMLLAHSAGSNGNLPYFMAPTMIAGALAAVCATVSCYLAADDNPGPWTFPMAGGLAVVAALCLYQAIARRFGPAVIDKSRYDLAQASLKDSGDGNTRPMPVLMMAAMAALFLVDGAFSGFVLTTSAFSSMFTPHMAKLASFTWSVAMAWLLYHLTSAAAREGAINARRALLRNLLASPRESDRARGEKMIEHVGSALRYDYSRGANRYRARVLLSIVVLGLFVSTAIVRVSSENDDIDAQPEAPLTTAPLTIAPKTAMPR
jgi:hypothetical protein